MIKKGDIKKLPNPNGEAFKVEVVNVFNYNKEEWAEVKPLEFNSFTREVKTSILY